MPCPDVYKRQLYESARFAREATYNGPLGPEYTPAGTRLRLWAPTAEQAAVNLYRKGHDSPCIGTLPLQRGPQGVCCLLYTSRCV